MIVYLRNSEIDREQWDNCINASQSIKPYAYSWYLDIMAPGWEALIDDDYDSVFPVPANTRIGIKYIATPIFLQQLGAFSPDKASENAIKEFLDYMPAFYRLIDLCVGQKVNYSPYKVTERANYVLDLSFPYEKLWSNFSSDCRRIIQIEARKKIEMTSQVSPDELIDLFVRNKGNMLKGIKPRDYQRLNNLMNYCITNKKGQIIGVRAARKRLIFGIFLIEISGSKTILFIANSPESREKRIGYFVVNELIKNNASTKNILDFAGSSIPSIAKFIESFGCENNPYYRIYRNSLPWPINMLK
jgi:hypothetical protein